MVGLQEMKNHNCKESENKKHQTKSKNVLKMFCLIKQTKKQVLN